MGSLILGQILNCVYQQQMRPEGAKAPSPGQRPGFTFSGFHSPCKGKSTNRFALCIRAFALTGRESARDSTSPGRCPGLGAFAPSGRVLGCSYFAYSCIIRVSLLMDQLMFISWLLVVIDGGFPCARASRFAGGLRKLPLMPMNYQK